MITNQYSILLLVSWSVHQLLVQVTLEQHRAWGADPLRSRKSKYNLQSDLPIHASVDSTNSDGVVL